MTKFSFALIFSLHVFNLIIRGNAVVTTPESENSTVQQNSDNIQNESNKEEIPDKEPRTDLSDGKNAAFTVIQEADSDYEPYDYVLPDISKIIDGKWMLSSIYFKDTKEAQLCPDINVKHDTAVLTAAYEDSPATQNCLFTKKFESDEPKICTNEPKPWLGVQNNIQPPVHEEVFLRTNCDKSNQQLLGFEYLNCNPVQQLLDYGEIAMTPKRQKKTIIPYSFEETYPMYEICYDTKAHKVLWTRHEIKEPMLMFDPTIPAINRERVDLDTIDTSTFGLKYLSSNEFTKLINVYKSENASMNPEYLVPMQHMAMQNWKKATHHIINTAPLHEKFHQLMQTINEGLIKASYHSFIQTGVNLQIFTTVQTKLSWRGFFEYSTWYKFVYDESNGAGILIYLHNELDGSIPKETCPSDFHCHFEKWVKPEPPIPKDVLAHAGCCGVNPERIKELFQIDVKINNLLGIHQNILSTDITDTRLRFMEYRNLTEIGNSQESNQDAKEDDSKQQELDARDANIDKDSSLPRSPSLTDTENQIKDSDEKKDNDSDQAEKGKDEIHDVNENKVEKPLEEDETTKPKKE